MRAYTAVFLIWLFLVPAASAAELGRLFLTPQQRQDLDRRRVTNRVEEDAPPQVKEGPLTLNGHVQRSGGRNTTWINGQPSFDSHSSRDPAQVTVVPNEGEAGVRLRIGETLDRNSGQIRGALRDGEIRIESGRAPSAGRINP
jgi:hypothetical protein